MSSGLVVVTNPEVIKTYILNITFEVSFHILNRFGSFRGSLEFSRELKSHNVSLLLLEVLFKKLSRKESGSKCSLQEELQLLYRK